MFLQSPKRGRYYSCRLDSRKGICKDFFESDALFLADVFKNNWNMYLEVYELDTADFLSAAGLTW